MSTIKLPGLIDPHVHLREPGATHKENFESGSKSAVAGGFVMVLDMPNNPEPTITREALDNKIKLSREKAVCDIGFIFGAYYRHPDPPTGGEGSIQIKSKDSSPSLARDQNDNTSQFPKVINDVYALKIYMDTTTGDLLIEEQDVLERAFSAWTSKKPIVVHAEDMTMDKAINLAKKHDKTLHIAHLSQKKELERVIIEKENGMKITCEVTPHHLFLSEKDVNNLGPYGMMKPPLRTQKDIDFLWKHIDAIDCIATDHAPHTREEKEGEKPAYGVPGLETSLPLMLNAVSENRIDLDTVVRMMHTRPKEIFGISISDNSYVQIDRNTKYEIRNSSLYTKCGWSPFDGMKVRGRIIKTVIRGKDVYNSTK